MKKQYGERWETIRSSLDKASETSVLINSLKNTGQFDSLKIVPWCEWGKLLPERTLFAADPLWHAGTYYVQEAASMFVSRVLEAAFPGKNLRVLDLCAAPGGKSHIIQNYLKGRGLLVSNEIIASRAAILKTNIQRFGHENALVISSDPSTLAQSGPLFDVVLCDAPCSGEGMFRKDHGARKEWNAGLPAFCASRQSDILASASSLLKEGGVLIYSTCTFASEENMDQLLGLWQKGDWESVRIPVEDEWGLEEMFREGISGYQLTPGLTCCGEGFFAGVLRKTGGIPKKRRKKENSLLQPAKSGVSGEWKSWLLNEENIFEDRTGNLWQVKSEMIDLLSDLEGNVKLLHAGVPLGTRVGNELVPDHGLSLSLALNNAVPSAELDLERARVFLRGGDPGRDLFSANGWHLVRFQGFGLGWGKALDRRVNNYYPRPLRLLHY